MIQVGGLECLLDTVIVQYDLFVRHLVLWEISVVFAVVLIDWQNVKKYLVEKYHFVDIYQSTGFLVISIILMLISLKCFFIF